MNTEYFDNLLKEDRLEAVFQPIVCMTGLTVIGFEGLIRGPAGSSLESPASLFAAARACNRQLELERRCVRTVCSRFSALGLSGRLFLNVSAAMFLSSTTHYRALIAELVHLRFDSRRIVIEITEEHAICDFRRVRRIVQYLRRQGFSLAIDDLGAGYASLRLWIELRPNWVKIDMLFVRGVERDAAKRAFISAIRDIARACESNVIAEGIETAEELAAVRDMGIDHGQGYHINFLMEA